MAITVAMAPLSTQGRLLSAALANKVQPAQQDHQDLLAEMALTARTPPTASLEETELHCHRSHHRRRHASSAQLVHLVRLATRDRRVHLVLVVTRVRPVPQARLETRDLQVRVVRPEMSAKLVPRAQLAQMAKRSKRKDLQDDQAHQELKDHQDLLDRLAIADEVARAALPETPEMPETRDQTESQLQLDHKATLAHVDHPDPATTVQHHERLQDSQRPQPQPRTKHRSAPRKAALSSSTRQLAIYLAIWTTYG